MRRQRGALAAAAAAPLLALLLLARGGAATCVDWNGNNPCLCAGDAQRAACEKSMACPAACPPSKVRERSARANGGRTQHIGGPHASALLPCLCLQAPLAREGRGSFLKSRKRAHTPPCASRPARPLASPLATQTKRTCTHPHAPPPCCQQNGDGALLADDPCLKLHGAAAGATAGAFSRTDRQCYAGPNKYDWRALLQSGADACACAHIKYDLTADWDEHGNDLGDKVCGGYGRVEAACTANAACAGFVMEPKTMNSYGWWYTCGVLKSKMRDAGERRALAERKDAAAGWRQGYDTFAKGWRTA